MLPAGNSVSQEKSWVRFHHQHPASCLVWWPPRRRNRWGNRLRHHPIRRDRIRNRAGIDVRPVSRAALGTVPTFGHRQAFGLFAGKKYVKMPATAMTMAASPVPVSTSPN